MRKSSNGIHAGAKVCYRPIEAAIRWSGLLRFEQRILDATRSKTLPDPEDFPRWPQLHLNAARILDALINGDLPYGRQGVTRNDPALLRSPELTIRHVDLKAWMARFYPDQKPEFLFDAIERQCHPALNVDTVLTLFAHKEAIDIQLAERIDAYEALQTRYQSLAQQQEAQDKTPGARGESTYLNIIGGLLTLLLGKSPSGVPYSTFRNMDAVISTLNAHYSDRFGMSERTLWSKLAAAKRHLGSK